MPQQSFGRVHTLTLPSGAKVRVRRPSTLTLVRTGVFPAELTSAVWKLADKGTDVMTAMQDPEQVKNYAEALDKFMPFVLVEPKIGEFTNVECDADGYTTGTVAVEDITDQDKQWLFFFGQNIFRSDDEQADSKDKAAKTEVMTDLQQFRDGTVRETPGPAGDALSQPAISTDRAEVSIPGA